MVEFLAKLLFVANEIVESCSHAVALLAENLKRILQLESQDPNEFPVIAANWFPVTGLEMECVTPITFGIKLN